jgi:glycosyltransferase involved in cell wall biosynthesis
VTRVLTVIESAAGGQVLGHGRLAASLREGEAHAPGVEAGFAVLPPLHGLSAALVRGVPGLNDRDLDLQATRWHVLQSLRARRLLRREIARQSADAAIVMSHAIALLADLGTPIPVMPSVDVPVWDWRVMGIWRPVRPHTRRLLAASLAMERRTLSRAPLVHVWSDWSEERVLAAAPRTRIFAAHPGIDVERYRPGVRAPRPRPRVLFVGGRFEEKGGNDLIAALEPLLGTDAELDVVTPAAVAPREGLRVHRLGADDPALLELFQQADVLCLPTRGDAVPLVVVEAMACGTPVVAADVGAIGELLGGGRAGVLVAPRDVAGLRATLTALLGDAGRRAELGEQGRALAEEHYDARRQGAAILERAAGLAS